MTATRSGVDLRSPGAPDGSLDRQACPEVYAKADTVAVRAQAATGLDARSHCHVAHRAHGACWPRECLWEIVFQNRSFGCTGL